MFVTPRFEWHYLTNAYEPYTARVLAKMCERASLFVDIGAHYGFFSLHVATCRPELKIIAVEPAKSNFEILNRNILLNDLKNIQTHNVAISDTTGEKPFHISEASDNCGLHIHPKSRLLRTEKVRTTTVDALLKTHRVGPIVIKIDTEGHEPSLLGGIKKTLQRFRDVAMFVEFNPKMLKVAGHDPSGFLQSIDELGLAIFLLDDEKQRHYRIEPETNWSACMNPEGYANLVCLPKERALSVLFVSHSSGMTGAERSLLELVDELITDYWLMATVLCPDTGPLTESLRDIGASVCVSSYGWWSAQTVRADAEVHIAADMRSIVRLLPLFQTINADIVWTQTMVIPWGAVIAFLLGKRHLWSICEYGEKDHNLKFFLPFKDILHFLERSSDFLFAGSPSLLSGLFPTLGPENSDFLYRCIRVPPRPQSRGKKLWRIKAATRIAVFGTIQAGKGQEDLVRALAQLKQRGHNVELLIAGSGSGDGYLLRLQDLVQELAITKAVIFSGFIDDPYAVMASADIVVTCSRSEAFGRTVIEAMLLSRPIVYSKAGSHLDYMIEGTTGLGYNPEDVAGLADQLGTLIANPRLRKSLGKKAKAYATETFTQAEYGGKAYRKLISLRDNRSRRTANMSDVIKLFDAGIDMLRCGKPAEPETALSLEVLDRDRRLSDAHAELRDRALQIENRDQQLITAGRDLRHLMAEVANRDQSLNALGDELKQTVIQADSDLRRAVDEIQERDRQLATADGEVRRLMAEVADRDQGLNALGDKLKQTAMQADSDLRRAVDEIQERDRQLATADGEVRRLMAEVADRDQGLNALGDKLKQTAMQADSDLRRAVDEIQERDRQLATADGELRRLMAEVADRDQSLNALGDELKHTAMQADSDLRRAIDEIQERDRQLATAGGEVRRLMAEVADRDQSLNALGEGLKQTVMQADSDLRRAVDEIQERDRQLATADGELRRLMAEVADRDQSLNALGDELKHTAMQADSDLRRAIDEIQERDRQLATAGGELRRLTNEVADRDQNLNALGEELKQTAMQADRDLRRAVDDIRERDRQLATVDSELRRLTAEVADRDQSLNALGDELKQTAMQADSDLRRATDEIQERDRQLLTANGDLRRFRAAIDDRDQRLLTLHEELEQISAQATNDLRDALAEIEERSERLLTYESRISDIELSTTWRLTAPLRKLSGRWREALHFRKKPH